jgi:N-glycosylase/DNA lyase
MTTFPVRDYDLAATLTSGQAFRWELRDGGWEAVVKARWVRLLSQPGAIQVQAAESLSDWRWLADYLQTGVDLGAVVASFPDDAPMRAAVRACRGLRLLRQDPWECLASFILSSNKQIVQIRQIVRRLCERFGEPVATPPGHEPAFAFPSAARLAQGTEAELRACKMGFRAAYLRATARLVAGGEAELAGLASLPIAAARQQLLRLPGVGRKIADCVLLFAFGFDRAFPLDVWVMKALRQLYFPRRRVSLARLRQFSETYFGPHGGYAQQYLFCYVRGRRQDRD